VSESPDQTSVSLAALGWAAFFDDQLMPDGAGRGRVRIATVHRASMTAESLYGPVRLTLAADANPADHALGDWVLVETETPMLVRRLDRKALLQRRTEGGRLPLLIAANVDTLFIVTSYNDDLNLARLERYLVLANEAETKPVIVLTTAVRAAVKDGALDQARLERWRKLREENRANTLFQSGPRGNKITRGSDKGR
jgi:ribosome biogenesis GTPase